MSRMQFFVARGETLDLDNDVRGSLRGSFARLSAGVTHYERSGPERGDLALMVPGITIPLFYWDDFVVELNRAGFRTLTYSAYGRGHSDRAVGEYDEAFFVRQAEELLEHLHLTGRVSHLIGTSMGALIAMRLLREPWLEVKTLTLIGPAGLEAKLPLGARLAKLPVVGEIVGRLLGQGSVTGHLHRNVRSASDLERLTEMISDAYRYKGSIYSLFSTLKNFPLVNRAALYESTGALRMPTLLGWGYEDQVTPIAKMKEVERMLAPTASEVIVHCGHMAPFEVPAHVARMFVNFTARMRVSA